METKVLLFNFLKNLLNLPVTHQIRNNRPDSVSSGIRNPVKNQIRPIPNTYITYTYICIYKSGYRGKQPHEPFINIFFNRKDLNAKLADWFNFNFHNLLQLQICVMVFMFSSYTNMQYDDFLCIITYTYNKQHIL